jgi:hypothetical protein
VFAEKWRGMQEQGGWRRLGGSACSHDLTTLQSTLTDEWGRRSREGKEYNLGLNLILPKKLDRWKIKSK